MKIIINRAELLDAASWVVRAVGKNPHLPVLMAMRLEVGESGALLSAFDYDTSLTASVSGEVGDPGTVLLPAHSFVQYLGTQRAENVVIQSDGKTVTVEAGRSRSEFAAVGNVEDYPAIPEAGGKPVGTVRSEVLEDALAKLVPVAGKKDDIAIRWRDGILITGEGEGVTFTAAISYRMGRLAYRARLDGLEVLVPASSLQAASKGMRGDVEVYQSGGFLALSTEDRTATVRLMDESLWPQSAMAVLTQERPHSLTVDRDELLGALKSISTSSDQVELQVTEDELELTTHNPTKGDRRSTVTEVVACRSDGSGVLFASIEHLTICLRGLDEGDIRIEAALNEAKSAHLIDGRGRYTFMPIRVKER